MAQCAVDAPSGGPHERETCWLMTIRRTSLLAGHCGVRWERSHASWTGGRSPSSLSSWRPAAAENQHGVRGRATAATTLRPGPRAWSQGSFGQRQLLPVPSDKAFCARSEKSGDCAGASRLRVHRTLPGLGSGGRRRRFRDARQPFGNASLTQTSCRSQTSGKLWERSHGTGNAHEPVQPALDTTSTGPAMCWTPPLRRG